MDRDEGLTMQIEHSGNSVYAVHTDSGPAVFPTLDDLMRAVQAGGDQEYYDGREWFPVDVETLALYEVA